MMFPTLIKTIFAVCSGDIISKLLAVLSTIILIRTLDHDDYGLYTNFMAVMSFISVSIGYGMNVSTTRFSAAYLSVHREQPRNIYTLNLAVQLVLYIPIGVAVLCYAPQISRIFFGTDVYAMAVMLGGAASVGLLIIQLASSIFQSSQDFKMYVVLLILRQLCILSAIIALFVFNYRSFTDVSVAISLVQIVFGMAVLFYLKDWLSVTGLELGTLRRLWTSGGTLALYFLFLSLFGQLDIFMLSRFRAPDEIAIYGVALRYYGLALMILPSIHLVLLPQFSSVEYGDHEKQRAFIMQWLKLSSLFIVPVLVLAFFTEPIFGILNGQRYVASIPLFRLFCIGIFISLVFSPLVNILIANDDHRFLLALSVSVFLLNFAGHYYFTSQYGAIGACIVTVVSSAIMNLTPFVKLYCQNAMVRSSELARASGG
jgi:O-antigen/teichoic acid export membrane protein